MRYALDCYFEKQEAAGLTGGENNAERRSNEIRAKGIISKQAGEPHADK